MSALPPWVCPFCYQELELAAGQDGEGIHIELHGRPARRADDGKPRPGDATVCLYCGELCIVAADLSLRRWTRRDRKALSDMMLRTIAASIKESIARADRRARREQGDELN
jgi:hypothetical protein